MENKKQILNDYDEILDIRIVLKKFLLKLCPLKAAISNLKQIKNSHVPREALRKT